jgi:hypothetical protein
MGLARTYISRIAVPGEQSSPATSHVATGGACAGQCRNQWAACRAPLMMREQRASNSRALLGTAAGGASDFAAIHLWPVSKSCIAAALVTCAAWPAPAVPMMSLRFSRHAIAGPTPPPSLGHGRPLPSSRMLFSANHATRAHIERRHAGCQQPRGLAMDHFACGSQAAALCARNTHAWRRAHGAQLQCFLGGIGCTSRHAECEILSSLGICHHLRKPFSY